MSMGGSARLSIGRYSSAHKMRQSNNAVYWARRKAREPLRQSEADRRAIVAAYQACGTVTGAADACSVDRKTARQWINVWKSTGSVVSPARHNSGRRRTATTPAVVARVVKEMTAPPEGAYVPSAAAVKRKLKLPFTEQSVRNAAKAGGLRSRPKQKRTFLSEANRTERLRWARAMLRARHNFRTTVNSDEKLFILEDTQRRCWMTDADPRYRNLRHHPQKVMIWGGISLLGCTDICFVDGKIDAAAYQAVLSKCLLPLSRTFAVPWTFQQDGARPHTAASTMAWMGTKGTPPPIPWPPYSPDLSPIENVWSLMVKDVNETNPTSVEALKKAIRNSGRKRTGDPKLLEELLGGWRGRVKELVAQKGGTLNY